MQRIISTDNVNTLSSSEGNYSSAKMVMDRYRGTCLNGCKDFAKNSHAKLKAAEFYNGVRNSLKNSEGILKFNSNFK